MSDILSYWDIYPDTINDVVERCEDALSKAGYTSTEINNWHESVKDNIILDNENITNSILQGYLCATAEMLEEKGYEADYYINCSDTHLYINGDEFYEGDDLPELEPSEEEIKHYTDVLCAMLETMDFSLDKQEDGNYCLVDEQGAYFGGMESYEDFEEGSAGAIVDRLCTYLNDHYFEDLEEIAEDEFDVDFSQIDVPADAEDWVKFMDEHEDFRETCFHEYEVMKLISSPEILDSINLDDVVQHFNPYASRSLEEVIRTVEKNEPEAAPLRPQWQNFGSPDYLNEGGVQLKMIPHLDERFDIEAIVLSPNPEDSNSMYAGYVPLDHLDIASCRNNQEFMEFHGLDENSTIEEIAVALAEENSKQGLGFPLEGNSYEPVDKVALGHKLQGEIGIDVSESLERLEAERAGLDLE